MGTGSGDGRHRLYDHEHESLGGLMAHLDGVLAGDPKRTVSIAVLVSKEGVEGCIDRARPSRFDASMRTARPGSGMFTIRLAREGEEPGRILVAKAPGSFVHLAITDEPRRLVEGTLVPFVKSLYPHVSRASLGASDLYGVMERLERSAGGGIAAAWLTAYGRLRVAGADRGGAKAVRRGGAPRRRRAAGAAVTYTGKPFRDAFGAAAANDQWVSGISFDLRGSTGSASMRDRLSRDGLFKFKHAIAPFYDKAFPLVARLVDRKTKLYSNRSREDNGGAIKPLAITLDNAMARDRSENSAFIRSMESMPHITLSVYHSSSYVHMSLVDYMDGSSFDIWILSTRQIVVVPQMRATHTSIARLTNHIFERFGEGSVADHEQ